MKSYAADGDTEAISKYNALFVPEMCTRGIFDYNRTISIAQAPLKVLLVLSNLCIARLVISLIECNADIKLYNLKSWLQDLFSDVLSKRTSWFKKSEKSSFRYYDVNRAIIQLIISNGIMFICMIANVSSGYITIADAVFYMTAIRTLAGVFKVA